MHGGIKTAGFSIPNDGLHTHDEADAAQERGHCKVKNIRGIATTDRKAWARMNTGNVIIAGNRLSAIGKPTLHHDNTAVQFCNSVLVCVCSSASLVPRVSVRRRPGTTSVNDGRPLSEVGLAVTLLGLPPVGSVDCVTDAQAAPAAPAAPAEPAAPAALAAPAPEITRGIYGQLSHPLRADLLPCTIHVIGVRNIVDVWREQGVGGERLSAAQSLAQEASRKGKGKGFGAAVDHGKILQCLGFTQEQALTLDCRGFQETWTCDMCLLQCLVGASVHVRAHLCCSCA